MTESNRANVMEDYELGWKLLRQFFNYEHYNNASERARIAINTNMEYSKKWQKISVLIRERNLLRGQPLTLVHEATNQVIDENSDEEAYIWLKKML